VLAFSLRLGSVSPLRSFQIACSPFSLETVALVTFLGRFALSAPSTRSPAWAMARLKRSRFERAMCIWDRSLEDVFRKPAFRRRHFETRGLRALRRPCCGVLFDADPVRWTRQNTAFPRAKYIYDRCRLQNSHIVTSSIPVEHGKASRLPPQEHHAFARRVAPRGASFVFAVVMI